MSLRMRRGSQPTIQGGEIFGPTLGAQSVRDNAGPRPVTVPGGAISFTTAADLQNKINVNPIGSTFVAANNIDWSTAVNTGTRAPKIYVPDGRIMDAGGRGTAVFGGAATGLIINDGAELHGGIWTNFGSAANGEVNAVSMAGYGSAKLVQDATFHTNWHKGLQVSGANSTADHCLMYNNGRYGWGGSNSYPTQCDVNTNCKVQYCEWYGNNTRGLNKDGDAGGTKVLHTLAMYVGYCWGHDNRGSGLWFDYNPGGHVVEENVLENNDRWGFFYEVGTSFATCGTTASAVVRNNYFTNNATDGTPQHEWFNHCELLSSCSDGQLNGGLGYEFHHNFVDTTKKAMGFIDHNYHPFDVKSFWAHDNDIWIRTTTLYDGIVGGYVDATGPNPQGDPFSAGFNNRFTNNHYHVTNTGSAYWRWAGSNRTWSAWQSFGHDTTGSLELI